MYFTTVTLNKSVITRVLLNQTSNLVLRYVWEESEKQWEIFTSFPADNCDKYDSCGACGNCIDTELSMCRCLKGFKPKSIRELVHSLNQKGSNKFKNQFRENNIVLGKQFLTNL